MRMYTIIVMECHGEIMKNISIGCEECLCNWDIGGWKDPRTPEKYSENEDEE